MSAFIGPAWTWLDPFTTIHDIGARALRAIGISGWETAEYPARLVQWPAVAGFVFFVWLELVVAGAGGGRSLGAIMFGYTAVTLVGMAQFGRDEWRANGETFSVWFGTLGRLARYTLDRDDPTATSVRRQPLGAGLDRTWAPWTTSLVVLVSLGAGSIIFDGLSQTQPYFNLFGAPGIPLPTAYLFIFLGTIAGLVLVVAQFVGLPALGAGVLPIAVGYLVAHYLTFLLLDGQRIVIAISDPLQQGWDIFGTAFFQPSIAWLPTGLALDDRARRGRRRAHGRCLGRARGGPPERPGRGPRRADPSGRRTGPPASSDPARDPHGLPHRPDPVVARTERSSRSPGRSRRRPRSAGRPDLRRRAHADPHDSRTTGPPRTAFLSTWSLQSTAWPTGCLPVRSCP